MKQFVVIGLGRFGGSIAKTLSELGHEVMAIDQDEQKVQDFLPIVTQTIQADATDEKLLLDLGVRNVDNAIVSIGDDIQASILATLILKDIGVPHVTVKAISELHQKVLEKIGADKVIHPERDMGIRVAHHLISKNILDHIEISSKYSIVEVVATEKVFGKSLAALDVRAKYHCNVIAIRSKDNKMNITPAADEKIQPGDVFIVIGRNEDIHAFEKKIGE
uniref:potassium channel family protein n=1 Tax=Risungbinella massiliensis TaxID=1329796 RepID=UPI000ACF6808